MKLMHRQFSVLMVISLLLVSCAQHAGEFPASPETLNALQALKFPTTSISDSFNQSRGIGPLPDVPTTPRFYQVGDREVFWVNRDTMNEEHERVEFKLRYKNEVVYMWVEDNLTWRDGIPIEDGHLQAMGDLFAEKIYPTVRAALGSEPNPGVDGDPHLHFIHYRSKNPDILGYYGASDRFSVEYIPHSNQIEAIYFNAPGFSPESGDYRAAMAHEFGHMVHIGANGGTETAWIGEGLAQLAEEINGYSPPPMSDFAANPDVQLNAHSYYPIDEWNAHCGADHAFMSYLYKRFGDVFVQDVVSPQTSGIQTIQGALDNHATGISFEQVFADFAAAFFLQIHPRGYGSWARSDVDVALTKVEEYPHNGLNTVHQFGSDYYLLLPDGVNEVTFTFDGQVSAAVLPTQARSGDSFWWAGRQGLSNLSRQVDLRQVKRATLKFSAWYDLYDEFEYAYVAVSTDEGQTWEVLSGNHTTDENPSGMNLGSGYTCKSALGCGMQDKTPKWINEKIDLTHFAGQEILLRFECNCGSQNSGFAIDDIEIPEIQFIDDAEKNAAGWDVLGFARIDNRLPQKFIVQAIEIGDHTTNIVCLELDEKNRGSYTTQGFGDNLSQVVIVISGVTPFTWELARYTYEINPAK